MTLFDAYLVVDWSAAGQPTRKDPGPDAVWVGEHVVAVNRTVADSSEMHFRTRMSCLDHLRDRLRAHMNAGRRVFLGFDFAYGYPSGFVGVCGIDGDGPPWRIVWNELGRLIKDNEDNTNNRFAVAGVLNSRCRGQPPAPFWGRPASQVVPGLDPKMPRYSYPVESGRVLEAMRETESRLSGVQSAWKLFGAGAVGGQTLLGIPAVARLRDSPEFAEMSRVWPFETGFGLSPVSSGTPFILHAEIWPGVVSGRLDPTLAIKDQAEVRAMTEWLAELDAGDRLLPLFGTPNGLSGDGLRRVVEEEGWIFGSG